MFAFNIWEPVLKTTNYFTSNYDYVLYLVGHSDLPNIVSEFPADERFELGDLQAVMHLAP